MILAAVALGSVYAGAALALGVWFPLPGVLLDQHGRHLRLPWWGWVLVGAAWPLVLGLAAVNTWRDGR